MSRKPGTFKQDAAARQAWGNAVLDKPYIDPDGDICLLARQFLRAVDRETAFRETLNFYASPDVYKPHPHGPAFDTRDLSFHARRALEATP